MIKRKPILFGMIIFYLICYSLMAHKNQDKSDLNMEVKIIQIEREQNPQNSLTLKPDLVIGLDNKNEEFLFYGIQNVQVDSRDNIYVADMRDKRIKVFDKNGNNLRMIGKRGQGPGEIQSVGEVTLAHDEILVSDAGNRRLTYFSASGDWIRSIPMGIHMIGKVTADYEGSILAQVVVFDEEAKQEIIKFDDELNPLFKIATIIDESLENEFDISPLQSRLYYGVTNKGYIIWGISSKYELNIVDSKGKYLKKIIKSIHPLEVSKDF